MEDTKLGDLLEMLKAETTMGWRELAESIPLIKLPKKTSIKIIPPFGGAIARFRLIRNDGEELSVYLDCHSALGYYGDFEHYWEAYPIDGDTWRCGKFEVEALEKCLKKWSKKGGK